METLKKVGRFLRILDEQDQLSLTNLAVYISMYRLVTVSNASFAEVGTFFLSVVAYNFKKTITLPGTETSVTQGVTSEETK